MTLLGFGLMDIEKVLKTSISERRDLDKIQAMMNRLDQVMKSVREVDMATARLAAAKTQLDEQVKSAS